MKEENKNLLVTEKEDTSSIKVTKQDVERMTSEELLMLLKEYEGQGRSVRFQEEAMTQGKKEQGLSYKYEFSWGWLMEQAALKGLVYGEDGHWNIEKKRDSVSNDVIIVRNVENKKKRTVEASEEAFVAFDALAGGRIVKNAINVELIR